MDKTEEMITVLPVPELGTNCLICGAFIRTSDFYSIHCGLICDECREAILEMKKMLKEKKDE